MRPFDGQILQSVGQNCNTMCRSAVGAWHQPLLASLEGEAGPGVVDRADLEIHPAGGEAGCRGRRCRRGPTSRPTLSSARSSHIVWRSVSPFRASRCACNSRSARREAEKEVNRRVGSGSELHLRWHRLQRPRQIPWASPSSATLKPGFTPSFLDKRPAPHVVIRNRQDC